MNFSVIGSIMAGALIAMGGMAFLSVDNNIVGSALFSLGLITIVSLKYDLFTGKAGHWVDWEFDEFGDRGYNLVSLAAVFGLNLIGSVGMATIAYMAGLLPDMSGIVATKMGAPWSELFFRGILCGMLMCIAVDGYKRLNNILVIILPVMVFILCGFEHSIADMFYLLGGLVGKATTFGEFLNRVGLIALIAVGNLIGGTIVWLSIKKIETEHGDE